MVKLGFVLGLSCLVLTVRELESVEAGAAPLQRGDAGA